MAFAFDTLGYANHLKRAGVDAKAAEAHAEAAREFIMTELTTQGDLAALRSDLDTKFLLVDQKIQGAVQSVTLRVGAIVAAVVTIAVAFLRLTGTAPV